MSASAVAPVEGADLLTLDPDAPRAGDPPHTPAEERGTADREAAWARALAEMEAVADHAEHLLAVARTPGPDVDVAVTQPWRTPRGLGPLPLALAPRAAALVERQRELVRRTADQLAEQRRALRTTDGLRTRAAAAPVYLDVQG